MKEYSIKSRPKIMYGAGEISGTLVFTVLPLFLSYYFTDILGLSAFLAGFAILLGNTWDAVIDPFIGNMSDRTRSRFGRRRPYFLYMAIPMGVSFVLLFSMPPGLSQPILFSLCTAAMMLLITVTSLYLVPYITYGMEIERSYDGRTSLTAWRMLFSVSFGLIGAVIPKMIWESAPVPSQGFFIMALVFAIPVSIAPLFPFFAGKEPPATIKEKSNFIKDILTALKNEHFVKALLIYVLSWGGVCVVQTLLIYYFKYVLGIEDRFEAIIAVLFGVTILMLPLWVWISKKLDKRKAYILGVMIFSIFILMLLLPGNIVRGIIWFIVPPLGLGLSALHVMPTAIMPEAIEATTGGNGGEGTYFGIQSFLFQAINAFMQFAVLFVLGLSGYISTTQDIAVQQPQSAITTIKLLISLMPVALFSFGIFTCTRFRIGRDKHNESMKTDTGVDVKGVDAL